jgi:hypothetical protein
VREQAPEKGRAEKPLKEGKTVPPKATMALPKAGTSASDTLAAPATKEAKMGSKKRKAGGTKDNQA